MNLLFLLFKKKNFKITIQLLNNFNSNKYNVIDKNLSVHRFTTVHNA